MARSRKSENEHWLAGTMPHDRADDSPSTFRASRPKMPKHLSEVARAKWREMERLLSKRGTLTGVDATALEIFCETYARWRALRAEIDKHGEMVDQTTCDNAGNPHTRRVQNPACKLEAQALAFIRQMLKEFSATPASRDKTKPAQPPAQSKPEPGTMGALCPELFNGKPGAKECIEL